MKIIFTLSVAIILSVNVFSQAPDWLWAKQLDGLEYSDCNDIAIDASGNINMIGSFKGTVDFDPGPGVFNLTAGGAIIYTDIFICRLDASGNFIWAKNLGWLTDDEGYGITTDAQGNIYATGFFKGTVDFDTGPGAYTLYGLGSQDIFVCKYDSSGNIIWAKKMGGDGSYNDGGMSIALDANCNVYTTGYFFNTGDFNPGAAVYNLISQGLADIFISKLDSAGNFLWAKKMGHWNGDISHSITVDASGNVISTGSFSSTVDFDPGPGVFNLMSSGTGAIYLSKLDSSGNFIWAKAWGGFGSSNIGLSVATDAAENVYSSGVFWGTADFDPDSGVYNIASLGGTDIYISKLDAAGNFIWAKTAGSSSGDDWSYSLVLDANSNIYTAGHFRAAMDFDPGPGVFNLTSFAYFDDIFILKLDSMGNFKWAKAQGGAIGDYGRATCLDPSGFLTVGGYFYSSSLTFGPYILNNSPDTSRPNTFIAKLDTSIITSSEEIKYSNHEIFFSPNPTTNEFTIYDLRFTILEVEIYNVLGEKIFSQQPTAKSQQQFSLDVSSFLAGMYFLKLKTDKGIKTAKFIKSAGF